jgi:hypothetical protein
LDEPRQRRRFVREDQRRGRAAEAASGDAPEAEAARVRDVERHEAGERGRPA